MDLYVLLGESGVGKTTIMKHLAKEDGVICISSGDMFKAIYTMPTKLITYKAVSNPDEAFESLYRRMPELVETYEDLKTKRSWIGNHICCLIESLRKLCPDLPSRSICHFASQAQAEGYKTLVTDCITLTEFRYLADIYPGFIAPFWLNCANPKPKAGVSSGDNRSFKTEDWHKVKEIMAHGHGINYKIEQTALIADFLAKVIKKSHHGSKQ